ncbi:MAG: Na/Pi cotransporter family protein [Candidatus Pacearchaeota archaeon]
MEIQTIIFCITGVILFLYAIISLSKKFETIVKEKIAFYLRNITKNPLKGTIFGFIITALNQSSSATTVLTIALVSSGLLSFYSSLGILFGANIGTTITVNLVALGITKISFAIVLAGFILSFIKKTKKIGEIVFYSGLVFFGLFLISLATASLKDNPLVLNIFSKTKNPLLALLISIIVTAIIQSSAITISSAILLTQQGLLELPTIIAIILGANIGTTITTLIASITGSLNSKRTALAHLLFNFVGTLIFLPFLQQICLLINPIAIPVANKAALFHIFFNLTTATIFLILIKPFSELIIKIVPGKDDSIEFLPHYINKIFIKNPKVALDLVKKELKREFILTEKMLQKTLPLIEHYKEKTFEEINYIEDAVDNLQGEIASFLDELSRKNKLNKEDLMTLINYSLIVDLIERIADRTLNIAQLSRYKHINKETLSKETMNALKEISRELLALNASCISIFENKKYDRKKEIELRNKIEKLKENYKKRLETGKEETSSAMLFSELITNIERIINKNKEITETIKTE